MSIRCGNCGSGMVYRDYVPGLPGGHGLACMKCGSPEPNGKFIKKGESKEENMDKTSKRETPAANITHETGGLLSDEEWTRKTDETTEKHPDLPSGAGDEKHGDVIAPAAAEPKEGDRDGNGGIMKRCRICKLVKRHHGHGLCSSCFWKHVKKPAQAAARAAKQAAKEKRPPGGPSACKKASEASIPAASLETHKIPPAPLPHRTAAQHDLGVGAVTVAPKSGNGGNSIILVFDGENDDDLLRRINTLARLCRRTADQQILHMLDLNVDDYAERLADRGIAP